jgi:archaeal type IV pilus assembly protein PilA
MTIQKMMKNEHAVSPVVGVMLMLVVTIIIAAVVSAFAGGLGGSQQKAPQASIDVQIKTNADDTMSGTNTVMTFTELSGDPIQTKDLAIVTYYTNKTGIVYKNKQTVTSAGVDLYGYDSLTRVPFINDMRYGYSGNNPAKDFGNFSWKSGDVLSTGTTAGTAALLAINSTSAPYTIIDPDFGPGSVVDVKILHVPSGQYILDKEVSVQ